MLHGSVDSDSNHYIPSKANVQEASILPGLGMPRRLEPVLIHVLECRGLSPSSAVGK